MKLLKCYISSFGKLQDFTHDFSSGFNIINEQNGWGKTTLSTFIKAMFYGLEDGKRDIDNNERKKFKTWHVDKAIGGYIDFEVSGKQYRINKTFGKKLSEDEVVIYDLSTFKDITKEFENPFEMGKYFFKVDSAAFKSTIYFSQKDLAVSSSESLSACITPEYNLGEGDSVEKALENLENKAKTYKKQRGDGGLIDDTKREIAQLEQEIARAKEGILSYNSITNSIKELENKINLTKENLKLYAERKDLVVKYEKEKNILEQIEKKKQLLSEKINRKKEILYSLGKEKVTLQEVENFSKIVKDFESVEQKIKSLENEVAKLSSISINKVEKKSNIPTIFIFLAITFFAISVVMFAISQFAIGGVLIGLGVIGLICFAILNAKSKKIVTSENAAAINEIESDKREIERLNIVNLERLKNIENFTSSFNFAYSNYLDFENILKSAIYEISKLDEIISLTTSEIEYLEKNIENIDISILAGESQGIIVERYNYFYKTFNSESVELATLKEQLKRYDDFIVNLPQLESERVSLIEKVVALQKEYELYNKTFKLLEVANEELKKKYRKPLEDRLNKYVSKITGSDKGKISVDVDLNVFVEDGGELKESAYFSQGFKNLFSICERFALIDMLFEDEKPFIILDDPFTNLDKEKIVEALSLVKEFAKDYQIIYFSCHESRM